MCWFVTIHLSGDGVRVLDEGARKWQSLDLRPVSGRNLGGSMQGGLSRFQVTHCGCSCDFYSDPMSAGGIDSGVARSRYQRRGWSQAKIERAIHSRCAAYKKRLEQAEQIGPRADFRELVVKLTREIGAVKLLAHFYTSSPDDEPATPNNEQTISLEEFLRSGFPPDTVVQVVG